MALLAPGTTTASPDAIHIAVPYRSQLDGSGYGPANCGPTAVGMALETFGLYVSSWDLRVAAMKLQGTWGEEYRDEWGVFIYNLAQVAEQHGVVVSGLYTQEGIKIDALRRWTLDDIRAHLDRQHLVIAQLEFRSLPGRAGAAYQGDHFVLLHGYEGADFIYSDPLPKNGGGPNRRIPGPTLLMAMERSDAPHAAFAVWR